MQILITGFGPFPGAPANPSGALARALARRRRPAFAGMVRAVHIFETSYAAVDRDLPMLLARRPDIVLMFGLAGRRRDVCIETRARNAVSVLFPDAHGNRPTTGLLQPRGPRALTGRAPFARLLAALRARPVPARLSRDAGRYLCNYAYWRALEQAQAGRTLVQFVHIPPLRGKLRPRRRPQRSLPTLAQAIGAAEAALLALVAASRR